MSIFAAARKCDLKILAEEFGEKVDDNHKLKHFKKMILASKEYDEESTKISVEQKLKLKFEPADNKIYSFGNQKMPALTSIGRIKADIEVDNVKAEGISIYVVPDDAQSVDLIIGRT
ncbi:hypothetical protein AVEN_204454-1 [Araneus ventricosus]|uniref:Uncharacterized protein n=1 Tax=Araneus ventricosus TaxID=182803 RepID=A0A4Y1ZSZ9_ARAVE|nr:hypothetical protein AVEN_249940-1 [Araneus ventricosus]GBL65449.1 hypothetical protein AVEN_204454-1 [Araneus ventricosus]